MLIDHQHHPHAIEIAVLAAFADTGDVGQPAWAERPGSVGHRDREAIHDVIVTRVRQGLRHGVLDEDERPPQASEAPVEGTLREQSGKQRPQVFAYITHDAALAFPGHPAAPLGCSTQTEHLAITHESGWATTDGHLRPDMSLVNIVHDDVQCGFPPTTVPWRNFWAP